MSLILKGIDLPKEGTVIHLIVQSDGKTQYITLGDGEPISDKDAEAIQIPKRHGKLIPLEDVFRAFPELEPYRQGLTGLTILKSEEEHESNT